MGKNAQLDDMKLLLANSGMKSPVDSGMKSLVGKNARVVEKTSVLICLLLARTLVVVVGKTSLSVETHVVN